MPERYWNKVLRLLGGMAVLAGMTILPATAETLPTMKDMIADAQASNVRSAVNASSHTLNWVNVRLKEEGKPQLFCRPASTGLSVDEQIAILTKWVEARPKVQAEEVPTFPKHLLDAMVAKFPC
ncbi:hypothetical protein CYK37_14975 [Mesorhizobium loti]|nr:hypothetical protein [Mesorhizobium loti]PLP58218.1 hypothetical protein CYK37_14975 [Mesorhizobium loti]